jgi:hypothetical protein
MASLSSLDFGTLHSIFLDTLFFGHNGYGSLSLKLDFFFPFLAVLYMLGCLGWVNVDKLCARVEERSRTDRIDDEV